jgi:cysteine desulfurase
MGEKRIIYLDHAATTPVKPSVADAMWPCMNTHFGNPSSIYRIARESRNAIETARAQVAKALGAEPGEIFLLPEGASPTTGRSKVLPLPTGKRETIS